ncbi:hypothetical protein V6N11_021986 [Hibiscus sabdariffa]|uniref:Fe2OG dioxygenase domain-containing protein n=1 Tax=Hibiscus sabdariffa TaxID=183260 RepID=A0ABR2TI27_9ROSI
MGVSSDNKSWCGSEGPAEDEGINGGFLLRVDIDREEEVCNGRKRSSRLWTRLWTSLCSFKEAVEEYSIQVQKVAEEINANLSELMGIGRDGLKSPHSDAGSLTLLLQDDDTSGLQIKHKGNWIPVKPIPNSLVLNIGNAIDDLVAAFWGDQILSNGVYKSIEHRAITNEKKARISVAAFAYPDDELEIGPLDSMVDHSHRPPMYRKVKYVDYISQIFARKMDEKAHIDLVKIQS